MVGRALWLVVVLVAVVASAEPLLDTQWQQLHSNLAECSSLLSFCKRTHTTGEVLHHGIHSTQEQCEGEGFTWHARLPHWTHLRNAAQSHARTLRKQADANHVYLVRFKETTRLNTLAKQRWRQSLGVSVDHHFRCNNTHFAFVHAHRDTVESAAFRSEVSLVVAVPPALKVAPEVELVPEEDLRVPVTLFVTLAIDTLSAGEVDALAASWWEAVRAQGVTAGEASRVSSERVVLANLDRADVPTVVSVISGMSHVLWIERKHLTRLHNVDAQYATQSGIVDSRPVWDRGLHGEGQVVAVGDSGLDYNSCFFIDPAHTVNVRPSEIYENPNHRKVVQYVAFADNVEGETTGHGTHVAGSVAGSDTSGTNTEFKGMAYASKIALFDIGVAGQQFLDVPNSLESTMFPPAYEVGARIHTNSWGASSNTYDTMARDIDRYTFANQDFLVLVAAGNSGDEGAGTLGTPATAKNCITVGASQNTDQSFNSLRRSCSGGSPCNESMAYFSSRGPRFDGAIAPDVVAPGQLIQSARSAASGTSCSIAALQGTSMATPVTAGNAALIRQYFTDGFYPSGEKKSGDGFVPLGAAIKAVLVNSARLLTGSMGGTPLDSTKPGNRQGFGAIQLDHTLFFKGDVRRLFVVGDTGNLVALDDGDASHEYTFDVSDAGASEPMGFTLVWADAAGTVGSSSALVNDLDLEVSCDGSGCLKSFSVNGQSGADTVNNVEHVEVAPSNVAAGQKYTVRVKASSVPSGPQPYALVVSGGFHDLSGGGGGGALSWGSSFMIAVAVCGFVYVVAGLAFTKHRHGQWGFPESHRKFWGSVPGLVSDGLKFSAATASSAASRVTNKGGSGAPRSPAVAVSSPAYSPPPMAAAQPQAAPSIASRLKPATPAPSAPARPDWLPSSARPKPSAPPAPAKSAWTVHLDPQTGNRYWHNAKTGESSWTNPQV